MVCHSDDLKSEVDYTKREVLPVVLYGCETWPLILREGHRLWIRTKVFTAVKIHIRFFWVVTPFCLIDGRQCFGGTQTYMNSVCGGVDSSVSR
jgi:hypothetical protein